MLLNLTGFENFTTMEVPTVMFSKTRFVFAFVAKLGFTFVLFN